MLRSQLQEQAYTDLDRGELQKLNSTKTKQNEESSSSDFDDDYVSR